MVRTRGAIRSPGTIRLRHRFVPEKFAVSKILVFPACVMKDALGSEKPSSASASFLKSSEKAMQQWELERRFREFQSTL